MGRMMWTILGAILAIWHAFTGMCASDDEHRETAGRTERRGRRAVITGRRVVGSAAIPFPFTTREE